MKWEQLPLFERVTFHGGGAHGRSQIMWWTQWPPHHYWYWPIFESPRYGFELSYFGDEPSGRAWLYRLRRDWNPAGHCWHYWYDFEREVSM